MVGSVSAQGVFRTLSNTYNGAFFCKNNVPYLVIFFVKKLHRGCLAFCPKCASVALFTIFTAITS